MIRNSGSPSRMAAQRAATAPPATCREGQRHHTEQRQDRHHGREAEIVADEGEPFSVASRGRDIGRQRSADDAAEIEGRRGRRYSAPPSGTSPPALCRTAHR